MDFRRNTDLDVYDQERDLAELSPAGLIAAVSEIAATVAAREVAARPPAVVRVPYPVPAPIAPIEVRIPAAPDAAAPAAFVRPGRRLYTRAEVVFWGGWSGILCGVAGLAELLVPGPWILFAPLAASLTTLGASMAVHRGENREQHARLRPADARQQIGQQIGQLTAAERRALPAGTDTGREGR
jgi:hypothetical protein